MTERHIAHIDSDPESLRRGGSCRQAACSCGWKGPERSTLVMAADDAAEHERQPNDAAPDTDRLHGKYVVRRTDGSSAPGRKHENCAYFVLDLDHDEYAIIAITAYARACRATNPGLAADLRRVVAAQREQDAAQCNCREVSCPHSLGQAFTKGASETARDLMAENDGEKP